MEDAHEPTIPNPSAIDSLRQVMEAGMILEEIVAATLEDASTFGDPEMAATCRRAMNLWRERIAIAARHTGPLS